MRERQEGYSGDNEPVVIIGRNAVLEALKGDNPIERVYVKSGSIEGTLKVILAIAREKGIVIKEVSPVKLDFMSGGENHQGVCAMAPAVKFLEPVDIVELAKARNEDPFIVILDEINDPRNLGAILRTAASAGVHGVVIPKRRGATVTPTVIKTSAGAALTLPIAKAGNIAQVIDQFKKKGLWVFCGDLTGKNIYKANFSGPVALVIGGEGKGVGRLIKDKCDYSVSIPMGEGVRSLNASVAAAIIMYEVLRGRSGYGKQ